MRLTPATMKKTVYHCIMFDYQGHPFMVDFMMPYPLTLSAMVKRFFQIVVDDGLKLSQLSNVEFQIGDDGLSSGVLLYRCFPSGFQCCTVHEERRP